MLCIYVIIVLETAQSKGDSLDIYMKSMKDKLDKGTMHEIKLQINKLKKVYMHTYVSTCMYVCMKELVYWFLVL